MMAWLLSLVVTRLLIRLRVSGRERLPAPNAGPVVVACNHLSWIDPLAIIAALGPRRPVVFLAAREHVERRPALRWLLGRLGAVILVDRGSGRQRDVLRAADAALRSGKSLALFPEGRVNVPATTGQLALPFEPGAAVIARRAAAPILPVAIAGSDDLHLGRLVRLAIAAPIGPERARGADAATTERVREAILAVLPPSPPRSRLRVGRWLGRLT
jgi:1-acyl-sn-glycerol-3-phosphate acyltransferase